MCGVIHVVGLWCVDCHAECRCRPKKAKLSLSEASNKGRDSVREIGVFRIWFSGFPVQRRRFSSDTDGQLLYTGLCS